MEDQGHHMQAGSRGPPGQSGTVSLERPGVSCEPLSLEHRNICLHRDDRAVERWKETGAARKNGLFQVRPERRCLGGDVSGHFKADQRREIATGGVKKPGRGL
ncbi:hypothetical protein A7D00_4489 [Trichophyton violaceum]|nr:hypothetical protein A7D00_4489 [Trichophyton violaceum]